MSHLLDQKKEAKQKNLLDAAYALFLEKGTGKTSISDIVEKANVAKGTFYLYFRDKEDILQSLMYRISYRVLAEAYTHVEKNRSEDFATNVLVLVDYIIEYFKRDVLVLRLMERNFSWPMVENRLAKCDDPLFERMMRDVRESPVMKNRTEDEVFKLIFIISELCGSTCYSSIVLGRPDKIDNMKPVLYSIIRKSLES